MSWNSETFATADFSVTSWLNDITSAHESAVKAAATASNGSSTASAAGDKTSTRYITKHRYRFRAAAIGLNLQLLVLMSALVLLDAS